MPFTGKFVKIDQMHELSYKSLAKPGLTTDGISEILKTAETNNAVYNITGCLIYHKGVFIQMLEGEKHDIIQLFDYIKNDERHSNIELLWEGPSDTRVFVEWRMAFYNPNVNASIQDLEEFEGKLMIFAKFCDKPTASTRLFWSSVCELLSSK